MLNYIEIQIQKGLTIGAFQTSNMNKRYGSRSQNSKHSLIDSFYLIQKQYFNI